MAKSDVPVVGQWSWWRKALYWIGGSLGRLAFFPGRLKVTGLENIPAEGGFILASNHVTYLDPPAVGGAILYKRRLCYMAHAGLFRIPLLGFIIPKVGAFPVTRGSADRKAIRTAVSLLKSGQPLLVFPEGTRAPNDDAHLPTEQGAAYIAALSGVPVIPVGIKGMARVWPKGSLIIRPLRAEMHIGEPLDLPMFADGKRSKEALEEAANAIMAGIVELTGLPHPGVAGSDSAVWPEGTGPDWKPKDVEKTED